MTTLSRHAAIRSRERLGLGTRGAAHLAAHALERGRDVTDFAGLFRRVLERMAQKNTARVRVYGEHIFVFDQHDDRVVTVYQVPQRFRGMLRRERLTN